MKFCDKLQKIRKENNITQEQLADKLNVSRQAVSKWESDTAYPDTEKLIQISKIFNISLDELINDTKNTKESNTVNKKFNFVETFNMIFDFVSKVISMFSAMKFWEKCKFLIEMGLLILVLIGISRITTNIILEIIRRIFMFMPMSIVNGISYIADTLLYIAWIILGGIIFIKVLKTRYLDYYVIISDDNVKERVVEEPIKELKEKKEYKVVIRDPKDSSFNLFKKIEKLFIIFMKCLSIFLLIPIIIAFVTFVVFLVISLAYTVNGLFFNGISIAIFGAILFTYLIIEYILKLLFNRKFIYRNMFIIFIASISLMGIGIGLSFNALSNFQLYEDTCEKTKTTKIEIDMKDNLLLYELNEAKDIVIDDKLDNIKIDVTVCGEANVNYYTYLEYNYSDSKQYYRLAIRNYYNNDIDRFKEILNDLKNKKIKTYDYNYYNYKIDKIYISNNNLTKLKENLANINE